MSQKLNLEIYEFELENYPWNLAFQNIIPGTDVKTQSLINSEVTECGIINTDVDITKYNNFRNHDIRSCDPIKGKIKVGDSSVALGSINNVDSFELFSIKSEDLIKFSNKFGAKGEINKVDYVREITTEFPSMAPLYHIFNIIIDDIKLILKQDWIGFNKDEHTFIKILKPETKDKFLIIGDMHGSYHSFIRILLRLLRMNIMDNNCLLKNNYNLIFLGDVVDRGKYAYEIVMLLFLLKIKNPNNVFLNRGNHEVSELNSRDGFKDEIESKFSKLNGENIHETINSVFNYYHSALLIKNPINGKYTYLAHGGFPTIFDGSPYPGFNFLDSYIDNKFFMLNSDIQYNLGFYSGVNSGENSIRWNDYWGHTNSKFDNRRRAIKIGEDDIKIIKTKDIELIIRGHQDRGLNTKLIKRLGTVNNLNLVDNFTDVNEFAPFGIATKTVGNKYHCYKFSHLITVDEHSGDLLVNEQADNILPVITLSTNTDKGRDLAKDSFGILKFTLDINPENDNCVIAGSPQEKALQNLRARKEEEEMHPAKKGRQNSTNSLSLSDDEEMNRKYLKYKRKYMELKKKLNK